MKQKSNPENEVVTRGILKVEVKKILKTDVTKIVKVEVQKELKKALSIEREWTQGKLNDLEYRLVNRMDFRFDVMDAKLDKTVDYIQKLADSVIKEHKEFEVESVSIKHNYNKLEERVYTLEGKVFPQVATFNILVQHPE